MDVTDTKNRRLRLIEDIEEETIYYSLAALKNKNVYFLAISFLFHLDFGITKYNKIIGCYDNYTFYTELIINQDLISEYFKSLFIVKFKHLIDINKVYNISFEINLNTGDYTVGIREDSKTIGLGRYKGSLKNNYNVGNGTKTFN